ncbi:MAG: SPFH domain-containing protein [Oscillospiraceae bacterium]|nr:SPFH domain-containing protein [Oscillospiraceae bacterium]
MGLLKAGFGALGGVLADQWKEYFYCDALDADVIAAKGQKRVSGRSSNTRGSENVISNGSVIAVADGQCMMIVDQGKVVEFCAEPGEFVYDSSTEPTIFEGKFGKALIDTFKNIGKRFTYGGEAPKDQRVYYFNTKELVGNKYGTPNPVPFRVVDQRAGIDIDIAIRCFGEYSYHICNPMLFYTNVCGNVEEDYTRGQLDSQLKTELLTALQPAFARISGMGIRYSALPGHTMELAEALNDVLSNKWREMRGLEIVSFGVSSVKATEEDEEMIKQLQRNAAFRDPTMAAAHLVGAQAEAMQSAAKNEGAGAAMAFMGMNMAGNAGGASVQNLYAMGAQNPAPQPVAQGWTCSCGAVSTGKFCTECGAKRPENKQGWTCSCGTLNRGNFCSECGAKKPAGTPKYRCDKCGWEPVDPQNPPKFCPECGDIFDQKDLA